MVMTDTDLVKIRAALNEVNRARQRLDRLVLDMRGRGATWTEIGYALNVSAQAAQKKYGTGSERAAAYQERAAARALRKRSRNSSRRCPPPALFSGHP